MTTDEAIKFFNTLKHQTTTKSELKIYDDFIQTLASLNKRSFSKVDVYSIETELDQLNLWSNPKHKKKYFRKALHTFKTYLKTEFSLTSKGYYTAIGMSLGMCFGVAFGSVIHEFIGIPSGLAIGLLIGLCVGRYMDIKAEKTGNVL